MPLQPETPTRPPRRVTHRRFSIVDGMWLVAGVAVGMTLSRAYLNSLRTPTATWNLEANIEAGYGIINITAIALMLVLIPLRLRRPRPSVRRLARQPGFVACISAAAALAIGSLHSLTLWGFRPWAQGWPFAQLWSMAQTHVMHAVAGAWVILLLSGRWRPEPGWIDRLGRVLGLILVVWMVLIPLILLVFFR